MEKMMDTNFTHTQLTVPSNNWNREHKPHQTEHFSSWIQLAFTAASFRGINLDAMEQVALQNRLDTKFGLSMQQLLVILPELRESYRMLTINGLRLQPYRTLYFDTPAFDLFRMHVNHRSHQYKVRMREYLATNQAFLEVKHKNQKERTIKTRIPLNSDLPILGQNEFSWLNQTMPKLDSDLEPGLLNEFSRIVLVDDHKTERITLDLDIRFSYGGNRVPAGQVVIAEVKQASRHQPSAFLDLMHAAHLRSMGFSKYCVGISLLYDNVKSNAQKTNLLWIERVNKG